MQVTSLLVSRSRKENKTLGYFFIHYDTLITNDETTKRQASISLQLLKNSIFYMMLLKLQVHNVYPATMSSLLKRFMEET